MDANRAGRSVKIEKQPLDILILLVERRGELVTREEIRNRLWADDVFRMLTKYAERLGYKWETISASPNEGGGMKEVVFAVKGDGAYSVFKW